MTDRAALLRPILERPDDDVRRLVYADWLEENGESERAEFIRLQIELATRYPAHASRPDLSCEKWHTNSDPKCPACSLQKREQELWAVIRQSLVGALPGSMKYNLDGATGIDTAEGHEFIVRRGFIATVRTTLAHWTGGPCPRCNGRGGWETGPHAEDCRHCNATGRTPGHGPRIVAEQPVETLVLSGREPLPFSGRFLWHNAEHRLTSLDYDGDERPADHLPAVLFNALTGQLPRPNYELVKSYPDRDCAMDALKRATPLALNWARREAGLPPLPNPG